MDGSAMSAWDDEQRELARAVSELAADRCPPERVRAVMDSESGWDEELWRLLAQDLGIAGITLPDAVGGGGGDFAAAAVAVEEAARALLPVPLTGHLVAVAALQGSDMRDLPADLGSGKCIAAVAVTDEPGSARRVLFGHIAAVLVVASPRGLFVVRRDEPDVSVEKQPSLDPTRPHSTVNFDEAAHQPVGNAATAARAVDLLRVALAAEAVGVARRCLAMTVDYVKVREQFGRPIGSFQALQHRLADLLVAGESAISAVRQAAAVAASPANDDSTESLAVVAPLAKAVCTEAAWRIAAQTIQLHGGIGFTWEHDAHLYFKRAMALRALLGSNWEQRELVYDRAGLSGRAPAVR